MLLLCMCVCACVCQEQVVLMSRVFVEVREVDALSVVDGSACGARCRLLDGRIDARVV